ncbi:dicarboxylate/amino acid:cation symporter [Photobacterium sanguinicancri]|uniref:Dicarboxylate/amino acid:cation symporter n=1 Tax=Photobacterium sanguinicancri TaxID=875932 RepID=A0AAW7Y6D3_9GAMM|nr:dicarboxylate/amino acid:cation symporter [Photobacterium sanguinicancri]KXI22674.1 sodium:glutamate symporter [Photobacterium sanguinicancri]MDO6542314.1 dicarboxylate/amino acid:cation symporter [Photobacterium sanguinicancri]OZS41504.1 dicarboxylate/amino acid:cation symporter [Photobacterium sanguinicancri]
MKLILKLIAGIVAGILLGFFAPDEIVRILLTVKSIGGQLIGFTIPLIILFYITSGIASLPKNSGNLLGKTVALSYGSTIIAGSLAFIVASSVITGIPSPDQTTVDAGAKLTSFISLEIPPMFGVMTALATAFLFGLGISVTNSVRLKEIADDGRSIIDLLLSKVIIPLLPFYISGIFAEMAAEGTVFTTLKTFGVVLALAVFMHWVWITIQYTITGLALGLSPIKLIKNMLPAYFTAIGTMSSAATIPVTLRQTKNNGVDESIANFTIPLCATIHLSGSTITLVTCSTAVMALSQHIALPSLLEMLPFIMMLGITMIAAPGAPGGGVMAALGLMASMLGFGEAELALMIALYMAQDSFGTACNITGDGAISLWVNKFAQKQPASTAETQTAK